MKCSIMLNFIRVFTVCKSTYSLGVARMSRLKFHTKLLTYPAVRVSTLNRTKCMRAVEILARLGKCTNSPESQMVDKA